MNDPVISARGLKRSFGRKDVLTGVDLTLGAGIHGLLGRNGVGKSTLLSIIAGQLAPSGGVVEVFGAHPFDNPATMDRTALTGVDVAYPGSWKLADIFTVAAMRYPQWDQAFADRLSEDFALSGQLRTKYDSLSRGQRAMVGIIVGLASRTQLLLLDEPYVGLDTHNTQVFYRHLLEESGSGRTIVMATHHIEDAARILSTALILGRDGTIAAHLAAEDADDFIVSKDPDGNTRLARPGHTAPPRGVAARTYPASFEDLLEYHLEVS